MKKMHIIFTILVSIIILFLIIASGNKSNYEKLYKVYSEDPTFKCTITKRCSNQSTATINGKQAIIIKKLDYADTNIFTQYYGNDKSSYNIKIEIGNDVFNGTINLNEEDNIPLTQPLSITFLFNKDDIMYTGVYDMTDKSLSFITTDKVNNENYYLAKNEANIILEYILNEINSDLNKYKH